MISGPIHGGDNASMSPDNSPGACRGRISAAIEGIREWRKRFALEKTLSGLVKWQLDDLGIARGEIPAYARAAIPAPRHLSAMLTRLGIALDDVRPRSPAYDELLRDCRVCLNVAVCRRWLATGNPSDGYRAFCPNAARFDWLPRSVENPPGKAHSRP